MSHPHADTGSQHACSNNHTVEQEEEQRALDRILNALRSYETKLSWEVSRWRHNYARLPDRHKQLLPDEPAKYKAVQDRIHNNQLFIRAMIDAFHEMRGEAAEPPSQHADDAQNFRGASAVSSADIDKVKYVFKNLVRDWSEEGAAERDASYGRILTELEVHFPERDFEAPPRVLVPGAGLARLCLDIAALGFETEGSEHSWYMLLTSAFILNSIQTPSQWTVFPHAHASCNQQSVENQLRGVGIPDVMPCELLPREGLLSMSAGEFVEVYSNPQCAGQFDCVVACFFIDTAHNICEYLEVIHKVLKDGGIWINLGPLMWHWSDSHLYMSSDELSIEVTLEDVIRIAKATGFEMLQQQMVQTPYTSDPRSMIQTVYNSAFWTMRKVAPPHKP